MRPRNTLVSVQIIEQAEKKVGAITISNNAEMYSEAIVIDVGPGNINLTGGRPETHDLRPGQRVLVKHQDVKMTGQGLVKAKTYMEYLIGDKKFQFFEQTHIIAIISEPPVH